MNYHENLIDKQDYKSFIVAFVIVISSICAMLFGFAWLSTTEKISADVYGAKNLRLRLENHVHPETNKGFTGKVVMVK